MKLDGAICKVLDRFFVFGLGAGQFPRSVPEKKKFAFRQIAD